ncbi:MAG: hypothetical protein A2W91_05485 [Bacteroidetes bacterium GWF2_38_335]|nr:MAG: hypothetical protein A2W91_05485 [Bacteroidetes bacterium GWF2_38_335]HBS88104.1 hypothetical protein [Bacteroidales bacterium]
MKIANVIYVILIFSVFIGCKKENEPFINTLNIKILNESGKNIDSISICSEQWDLAGSEKAKYYNIENNCEGNFIEFINLKSDFLFITYFDSTFYKIMWTNPGSELDKETRTRYMPSGYYTYTLFDYDSTNSSISIGLTDYYN